MSYSSCCASEASAIMSSRICAAFITILVKDNGWIFMWITNERILFEDAFLITLTTKYTQGTEIKVIFLTDVVIETSVA
jgi:hypothetical protein